MTPLEHLDHLTEDTRRYGAVLRTGSLDAPVPGCPDWTLRDLTRHVGTVHRWALAQATGAPREPRRTVPDDELAGWFTVGADQLHAGLAAADPAAACPTFAGPGQVAFWVRRMAHELLVHRVDAQRAGRLEPDPLDPLLAADGIAEVVEVMLPRLADQENGPRRPLVLLTPEGSWTVDVPGAGGPAPVTVRGRSGDVLLALWGRSAAVAVDDPEAWDRLQAAGLVP